MLPLTFKVAPKPAQEKQVVDFSVNVDADAFCLDFYTASILCPGDLPIQMQIL